MKDPENTTLLVVGWNVDGIIANLNLSTYVAVSLRKIGLKSLNFRSRKFRFKSDLIVSYLKQRNEIIDLRSITDKNDPNYEYWFNIYEIINKPKFFLARIKFGF